jgi:hypothetical protein
MALQSPISHATCSTLGSAHHTTKVPGGDIFEQASRPFRWAQMHSHLIAPYHMAPQQRNFIV